jgi:hypothetical protein
VFCLLDITLQPPAHAGSSLVEFFYPEDEGDTFLRNVGSTWRHIPEDGILHSHRRESLKSYNSDDASHVKRFMLINNKHIYYKIYEVVIFLRNTT